MSMTKAQTQNQVTMATWHKIAMLRVQRTLSYLLTLILKVGILQFSNNKNTIWGGGGQTI